MNYNLIVLTLASLRYILLPLTFHEFGTLKTKEVKRPRSHVYDSAKEWDYITNLILSGNHFAFSRWNDGEYEILHKGEIGPNIDGWSLKPTKNRKSQLALDMGEILTSSRFHKPNHFFGMVCDKEFGNLHQWFAGINEQSVAYHSWATLWVNGNIGRTKRFIQNLDNVVIVTNDRIRENITYPWVSNNYIIPTDSVQQWEHEKSRNRIRKKFHKIAEENRNSTILISAGPVATMMAHEMFEVNPENTYVDIGSVLIEFFEEIGTKRTYWPLSCNGYGGDEIWRRQDLCEAFPGRQMQYRGLSFCNED